MNILLTETSIDMPDDALDRVIFPDDLDRADFSIIGLHGRNANKYAFFPFVRQMGFLHTRWILPSGAFASIQSQEVRSWFNSESQNVDEMIRSRTLIMELIDAQIAEGISPENIFIVGFSQGAVMALDTGLRYRKRLGGIVALSGYVAHPERLARERSEANARVPIFLGHGIHDEAISIKIGRRNAEILTEMGYQVMPREYSTGHRICSEELRDIRSFLHRHMYGIQIDDPRRTNEHIVQF